MKICYPINQDCTKHINITKTASQTDKLQVQHVPRVPYVLAGICFHTLKREAMLLTMLYVKCQHKTSYEQHDDSFYSL